MQKQKLLEKISQSSKLPILPDIAVRVLELKDDPELYPAKVRSVIAADPVLSARILQVANSAMFNKRRQVTDLGEAVTTLGVELSMSLATGLAVVDSLRLDELETSEFPYETFWRKSILSAIAASEMASQLNVNSRGELFVAALMQDIGMLALNSISGERYGKLVRLARSHLDLVELEERAFGVNHAEVTAVLLKKWDLPESLCEAAELSHSLFSDDTTYELSDLQYGVALSGVLAELWIADAPEQEVLNNTIHAYLDKVGEDTYRSTVSNILDSIPGANEVFKVELLSEAQLANVA